jgi:hypothetical protein
VKMAESELGGMPLVTEPDRWVMPPLVV